MRKPRSVINDKKAISVIYDTLLFLIFVSIAGVMLLPAFIPSNLVSSQEYKIYDMDTEATLHLLMVSTCDEFNYTIAKEIIDPFAETIGINTSHQSGIYHNMIQWTLGKQQQHKTFGEHISELLYCMIEFPISENDSLHLNMLTYDYEIQLRNHLSSYLDENIADKYEYHLVASWRPIKNIAFGGQLEMGLTPPSVVDTSVSTQLITMPFLPMITLNDTTIILSEHWISTMIQSKLDSIDLCTNLTIISEGLQQVTNLSEEAYYHNAQVENLSSFCFDVLFDGISDTNNTKIIPGILSLIVTGYLNDFSKTIEDMGQQYIENTTGYAYSALDNFFLQSDPSLDTYFTSYIKNIICDTIISTINSSIEMQNLTYHIKQIILSSMKALLQPILTPMISSFFSSVMFDGDCMSVINELISLLFSQLSLTQATVTLTIWEGTVQ